MKVVKKMTNLEYLRMKIPDKSAELFTDQELTEIIADNSIINLALAEPLDIEKKIWKIRFKRVDENYQERVFVNGVEIQQFSFDKETGTLTFSTPVGGTVVVQAKIIYWNDVLADCYEIIMGDYKKLSSFNLANASQSMDDIKAHLRMLVRHYRGVKGAEL